LCVCEPLGHPVGLDLHSSGKIRFSRVQRIPDSGIIAEINIPVFENRNSRNKIPDFGFRIRNTLPSLRDLVAAGGFLVGRKRSSAFLHRVKQP
jgi:hypothetical protein